MGLKYRYFSLIILFIAYSHTSYANNNTIIIDDFEKGLKPLWKTKIFKARTRYSVIKIEGNNVLKAESVASASGLIYEIKYNTKEYPVLSWRWKVQNIIKKGDAKTMESDDYAARVYVIFPHWIPTLTKSINYIWANKLEKGKHIPNTHYSKAIMVAVESGEKKIGKWIEEKRNVYEDFIKLFNADPPYARGIAIMTDTDNTSESAVAFYDDIKIEKKSNR